jgi:hypothetical protein
MIGKRAKSDKSPPTDLACWDKFFAAKPLIPARFARFSCQIRRSFPELHFGRRNVKKLIPDRDSQNRLSHLVGWANWRNAKAACLRVRHGTTEEERIWANTSRPFGSAGIFGFP